MTSELGLGASAEGYAMGEARKCVCSVPQMSRVGEAGVRLG